MKLKFKDVLPNPYRDLKGNPPLKEKIAELKSSIETTGFWDNVVVRKNKVGKYERAYGEHRVRAAIEAGLVEADFIVKNLDDAMMIKIMDNENREVYASSPASLIEAVKAVVRALAEGSIPPFKVDSKARKDRLRYAPSFVPGNDVDRSSIQIPYTALNIADFLGRTKTCGGSKKADETITAALDYLRLHEKGYITPLVLNGKDRTGETRPITTNELKKITSEIQETVVQVEERRDKSAAEIAKMNVERLAMQKKAKADEKAAEEAHKALVKKLADAQREENLRKTDALAKQIKENDKRAQEKEALNKERMAELDAQLKAKAEWEAQQVVQDAYLPIRRDVEAMLGRLETIVSERNPFREDVKKLSKQKVYETVNVIDKEGKNVTRVRLLAEISSGDLIRLRKAATAVADWYGDWVAPQFAPELKAAQKMAVSKLKGTKK